MSKKILGLDVGPDAVTAALVVSGIKGARVVSTIRLAFQEDEDTDAALHRCLDTLHHQVDTSGAVCVAALPADAFSFRNIRLPFKEERKIRQVLPFEVESILPASGEEVVIDFHTVAPNGQQGPTQVVTAAVDRPRLQQFLQRLGDHQLDPEIVTVGGYGEAACLAGSSKAPGSWFFVSLGAAQATITIARNGQVLLVRRIERDTGRPEELEALCRRIHQTRLLCENLNHAAVEPEVVYWSGAAADPEAVASQLGRRFECRVEKVDLLSMCDFKWAPATAPFAPPPQEDTDRALALALVELTGAKALNFRRGPFALGKQWLEYKGHFLRTGALLLLVCLLGFAQLYTENRALDQRVQALRQQTRSMFANAFPEVERIVDPVQQMRVKIQEMKKQLALSGSPEAAKLKIDLLRSLSSRVPPGIDLEVTRLVIGPDSMLISGNTATFNAVDEIKSALEKDPLFASATINSANLEKSGERVNFKIRIDL